MRHHQADSYSHYRGPRRRREREKTAEDVFAEIMTENSCNLGKETFRSRKSREFQSR